MTEHALGNGDAARQELKTANQLAGAELAGSPAWNRKLTLQLLRKDAESRIGKPAENDGSKIPPPPPLPR